MSDIHKWLEEEAKLFDEQGFQIDYEHGCKLQEAADELARLTARNELLEKVLVAAELILEEADNTAECPYEAVSPMYIQKILQDNIAACSEVDKPSESDFRVGMSGKRGR